MRLAHDNDEHAEWLGDVLMGLNIERANLVGLSNGSWLILKFAAYAPQRIARRADESKRDHVCALSLHARAPARPGGHSRRQRRAGWRVAHAPDGNARDDADPRRLAAFLAPGEVRASACVDAARTSSTTSSGLHTPSRVDEMIHWLCGAPALAPG